MSHLQSIQYKDALRDHESAIAIIGIGSKFPGATNLDDFWQLLQDGRCAITHFSDETLLAAGISQDTLHNKNYIKARGILNDINFKPNQQGFISRLEDEMINPLSYTFLELVWHALEDASIDPLACPKKTAVFTGADYNMLTGQSTPSSHSALQEIKQFAFTSALSSIVAYQYNCQGKTLNLHTGCSTSLVAVIQACEEIISGRADLAIAGAISLIYPEQAGYFHEKTDPLSPTGRCRPFEANADGTVLSSGAGVVILKRLTQALEDKNYIHAVIRGGAINNDGHMKTGFFVSSIQGQVACIKQAWAEAKVSLEQVDYIETHGAATPVGDPMEIYALKKLCHQKKYTKKFCGIGSVKANIGHATVASGMAAIIKSILMLKYRKVPPLANFSTLNPNITLDHTPYYISKESVELANNKQSPNIGISNFGLGGTNAHLVVSNH